MNKRNGFLKKLLGFMTAGAVMLFMGCSEAVIGGSVSDGIDDDVYALNVHANIKDTNGDTLFSVGEDGLSDRTILPVENQDASKLTFTLKSKDGTLSGKKTRLEEFIITDFAKPIVLPKTSWTLTLTAYDGADLTAETIKTANKLYSGDKYIISGYAGSTIDFVLDSTQITGKAGAIEIEGTYVNYSGIVDHYKIGLYDGESGLPIADQVDEVSKEKVNGTIKYTRDADKVPKGNYSFKIYFYNASNVQVGFWGTKVIADAGKAIKANIGELDVINQKPKEPTSLMVYYKEPDSTAANFRSGYYIAHVTWNDVADNEEQYVLTLDEYDDFDDTDPAKTTDFDANIISNTAYYAGGSLDCSSEGVDLYLPTGHYYDFSIKARNKIADSDSVDRSAATTLEGWTGYTAAQKVTLTRVDYNLNGATLKIGDKTYNGSPYSKYYVYENTPVDLIKNDKTNYTISRSGSAFTTWVLTGTTTGESQLSSVEDMSVTASFNSSYTIGYTFSNYGEIDIAKVSLKYEDEDGAEIDVKTKGTVDIKNGAKNISIEITNDDTTVFEKFKIYFNDSIMAEGSKTSYTISTDADDVPEYGWVTVTICGYDQETTKWYSCYTTFKIVR